MNSALILENLTKLDNICRFVFILETKFSTNQKLSLSLKIIRSKLRESLIDLTFDIQKKLEIMHFKNQSLEKTTSKIENAFCQLEDLLIQTEIKDYDLLKRDIQNLILFMKIYENQISLISLLKDEVELKNLRERMLEIVSERFS